MYNKVLVIGSGPIVIGQAAEFDYSGTQACSILKEAGIEVVLVNNNPATIMTDKKYADKVYSEPLNVAYLTRIIEIEKPDAILPGMGGQTALNLSMALDSAGVLEKHNIQVLGTSIENINNAEDRELFKNLMLSIHQPCLTSYTANSFEDAKKYAEMIGYPIVVRPAFTLGGTGGGFCDDESELEAVVSRGLNASQSNQVLIEKSIKGWKEIEYEMMRDHKGNTIVVCNMENIDPVGVHTGDSIVVAPSQTLSDEAYQLLRSASIKIVSALNIIGGCNVQIALHPETLEYYIIEVNPRVSRSSALASKATGYPIAKIATKIALGQSLDEIQNAVTKRTTACFEPALDYCVVKIPKWPFNKFSGVNNKLGTQMKATGEVMAIGVNFESALLKAIRGLDSGYDSLMNDKINALVLDELFEAIQTPTDDRIFQIAELLRREVSIYKINQLTAINLFFLKKIKRIVELEKEIFGRKIEFIEKNQLRKMKQLGFSDLFIARATNQTENAIRTILKCYGIKAVYKMVDTCAGEFEAYSPYYYSTYDPFNENIITEKKKILVVGSGPITIGQGIEFDYCSVHAIEVLKKLGYETLLINNNPETVSTDFDISDKLFFEPITIEDVLNIVDMEKPEAVLLQFGGQTAIKLAEKIHQSGIKILGVDYQSINKAEDRNLFINLMDDLKINTPKGDEAKTLDEGLRIAEKLGYPLMVRPHYVIGGEGMKIVYSEEGLISHLESLDISSGILLDEYIPGVEVEVDCITDSDEIFIPGIMEHLEKAGVHSGDSTSIYPPQNLSNKIKNMIVETSHKICEALEVTGIVNIQYVILNDTLYVIEVNPRASRTIPFLSKVTGIPIIDIAVNTMLGKTLSQQGYNVRLSKDQDFVAMKLPVFSMEKIVDGEMALNPIMKSTGELLSIGSNFIEAYGKGLEGLNAFNSKKKVLLSIADDVKSEMLTTVNLLNALNYELYATEGTKNYLNGYGINVNSINKIGKENNVLDLINSQELAMVINIPTEGYKAHRDGFRIRRSAIENRVPCYTQLDAVHAKVNALVNYNRDNIKLFEITSIN